MVITDERRNHRHIILYNIIIEYLYYMSMV